MKFDNIDSIRYLMKEMDPSEEIIFEQEMIKDDDLLIEVECLRKVNNQLEELPEITPPKEVTDQVLANASRHIRQKSRKSQMKYFYISAAASIIGVLFAGVFLITLEDENTGTATGINSESQEQVQEAASPAGGSVSSSIDYNNSSSSSGSGVTPWVDNNDVLHFQDQVNNVHTSVFDSLFRNSYQKLQLVQPNTGQPVERSPDLHLTGSGN